MNENVKKVRAWIDENQDEMVKVVKDLISMPSVNNAFEEKEELKGEGDCQRYMKQYFSDMGIEGEFTWPSAEKLKYCEGKAGYYADHVFDDRPNFYANHKGTGGGKSLMFSGHMDVVTVGEGWLTDPFDPIEVDGKIYGRGTSDMKGGCAAMAFAIKAIKECGINLSGDLMIGTTVDEEAGSMGTLAFVEEGYKADACIIPESTNNEVTPMCRGILWGKLVIPGRAGLNEIKHKHWSEGGAVDAIEKAQIFMDSFKILNDEWAYTRTHKYIPIPCQIYIAEFHGGSYPTSYAETAEVVFNAQYLPSEKDSEGLGSWLKNEITQFVEKIANTDDFLRENPPYIEWQIDANCAEVLDEDPFMQSIFKTYKDNERELKVKGMCGHTDLEFFCAKGIPTINLGPGFGDTCHQPNEYIYIKDLVENAKILAEIALDWCK